jgi:hypothetical protein
VDARVAGQDAFAGGERDELAAGVVGVSRRACRVVVQGGGEVAIGGREEVWELLVGAADEEQEGWEVEGGVAGLAPGDGEEVVVAAEPFDLFAGAAGAVVLEHDRGALAGGRPRSVQAGSSLR